MLANPVFVYISIWTVVILLYSLGLSEFLQPLNLLTVYFLLFSSFCFLFGWSIVAVPSSGFKMKKLYINLHIYKSALQKRTVHTKATLLLFLWLIFTVLEVVYFRNLPILSLIGVGPSLRYTEFGFPGIHGVLNAIYFALFNYFLLRFVLLKCKKSLLIISILFLWPLLIMQRMMYIAIFLQSFFLIFIVYSRVLTLKFYFLSFFFSILIILFFGFLGDIRSESRDHLLALAGFNFAYPDWLPSGFAWVYLYVTTPLNNFNHVISDFLYPNSVPINILTSYFPSFIRQTVVDAFVEVSNEINLVNTAFNVRTGFMPILMDFGAVMGPMFFIIIGGTIRVFVQKAINNPAFILFWVAFLYSVVISVFSNHMFHLVFLFEALFGYFIFRRSI